LQEGQPFYLKQMALVLNSLHIQAVPPPEKTPWDRRMLNEIGLPGGAALYLPLPNDHGDPALKPTD